MYDLSAMEGNRGDWQLGIQLHEGERRILNVMLTAAVNISGTLLMLDDTTPHVAVPVQAIIPRAPAAPTSVGENEKSPLSLDGSGAGDEDELKIIAGTLSDAEGKYQFINLKPGRYQVRCYTSNGYVYYGSNPSPNPPSSFLPPKRETKGGKEGGEVLHVDNQTYRRFFRLKNTAKSR